MANDRIISYSASVCAFFLSIGLLAGCIPANNNSSKSSTQAPIPCLEQIVKSNYEAWRNENIKEIENLKEISQKEDWNLLVACNRSLKTINLYNSECETLFTSQNKIRYASLQADGKVVFIETKYGITQKEDKNFTVVLKDGSELLRLRLKQGLLLGCYIGGNPIVLKNDRLIYPDGNRVVLHEMPSGKERVLYEGNKGTSLLSVYEAANRIFLVMTDAKRDPEQSEMVILDSDLRINRRIPQVTNIMIACSKILIEKNGRILNYGAAGDDSKVLAEGTLLAIVDDDSFLFTNSVWKTKENGWLRLDYSINEYSFVAGKSRKIAGDFSIDACYGVTFPMVSPDKEYVIVCDNTESALLDSEYLIYRLSSGEKVCAFYEPYAGKYYFTYLLNWSDAASRKKSAVAMPAASK